MIKLMEDVRVTKNFTLDEFANHLSGGTYLKIDLDLIYKLQEIRNIVGPTEITSGYRTPSFNSSVGGSSNSYHLKGIAADVKFGFSVWGVEALKDLFSGIGFNNMGIYLNSQNKIQWIHCDIGTPWSSWSKHNGMSYKIYHV